MGVDMFRVITGTVGFVGVKLESVGLRVWKVGVRVWKVGVRVCALLLKCM